MSRIEERRRIQRVLCFGAVRRALRNQQRRKLWRDSPLFICRGIGSNWQEWGGPEPSPPQPASTTTAHRTGCCSGDDTADDA